MIKFNTPYIDMAQYPISLYEYLKLLCSQIGIQLENESLINGDYQLQGNPFTNNETNITVLSNIAQLAGGIAKISRINKLKIINLNTTQNEENIVETIDGNNYNDTFTKKNIWGEVNSLIIRLSDIEGENVTRQDEESIAQNGLTELTIADNYFLSTMQDRENVVDELWNNLKGLKYLPVTTEYYGYPYLDIGDLIEIKDNSDMSYYTYIFNHTFKYNGMYTGKIETTAMTKTQTAYKNTSLKEKFKRTEYIVDKVNQKITQVVEEQDEHDKKITQVEQDVDSIKQTTSNAVNYKRIAEGTTEIHLYEAGQAEILKLEVKGSKEYTSELYPRNNLYPRANLQVNQKGG